VLELIQTGVDPKHQIEQCDYCGHVFVEGDEAIETCSHIQYLTLCRDCYDRAGNSVR